jgi:hypothetical protein
MTNRMNGHGAGECAGSVKITRGASISRQSGRRDAAVVPESGVLTGGMGSATTPCRVLNNPRLRVGGRTGLTHEVGEPTDTGFCEGSGKKFFARIC